MLYHYLFRGWVADNMSDLQFEELGECFKYGYLGVDVFFIISGFVILLSIQSFSIYKFIRSRISRLYPAFWVSVIITFLVSYFYGSERYAVDFKQLSANLTMLNGFVGIKNIDGVYWTLLYEIKFYILVLFFLILNRFGIKVVNFVFFWLLLSITYWGFIQFFNSENLLLKGLNYFFIFKYSHYFISGCVFSLIYKDGFKIKYMCALFFSYLLSIYWANEKIIFFENKYDVSFSFEWIAAIIFSFYVFFTLLVTNKLNFLNRKEFITLGVLTYPLYLIHQNIGFIIFNNFKSTTGRYLLLFLVISVMLLISYLINKIIEKRLSSVLIIKMDKLKAYVVKN